MELVTSVRAIDTRDSARHSWSALVFLSTLGSLLSLVSGLGLAMLSATGVITASPETAYSTIALLIGFFVMFFVAADCIDRLNRLDKEERMRRAEEQMSARRSAISSGNDDRFGSG